jgi:CheY-like chemotaxis protein
MKRPKPALEVPAAHPVVDARAEQAIDPRPAEAQVAIADRFASVGALAAGLAHDINNPLAAVIANLDLALREVRSGASRVSSDLLEELTDAREAAERVRIIVRDMGVYGDRLRAPDPSAETGGTLAPSRRGRVLVIDDEPIIGAIVRRTLAEHDVVALTSARAALALLERGARFDLILCDVTMPRMTGVEFHDALRRDFPGEESKLVFLTGGAFTPDARAFLETSPNVRVEKPFEPGHLRSLVHDRIR